MVRPTYGSGISSTPDGYVRRWAPDHPLAYDYGYVQEHRYVAWEAGILTDPAMHVHHKNGVKDDNRIENLEVLTASDHTKQHVHETGCVTNQYGTWPVGRTAEERNHNNYLRQKAKGNR